MSNEDLPLIAGETTRVKLGHDTHNATLDVVNEEGSVRVPLTIPQVETLAHATPGGSAPREIERKFLVEAAPKLESYPHHHLKQGYLVISEDAVLRIREKGDRCKLTIKRGHGLDRAEVEIEVSEEQAAMLWPLAGKRVIDKTRYIIPDETGELELDVYHGLHKGLVVVEREFDNIETATKWTPPSWASKEITTDGTYTNAELARRAALGIPLKDSKDHLS